MLEDFENTYLVIDALDECLERNELMANIEELTSWKERNVHILATSRWEEIIAESIKPLSHREERICIQSRLMNIDIRSYIRGRLRIDRNLKRWQTKPEVQQEIEDTLMGKADGM